MFCAASGEDLTEFTFVIPLSLRDLFMVLNAPLNPQIVLLLHPSSDQTSEGLLLLKKKKFFSLLMVICIILNLQRPCSHFPPLFSAIINQWPSARDQTGMNASTKCSFQRHPGKWLSLVTNSKPIYSNAMDWSPYCCRSSASPRHTRSACSVNQVQDIAPWARVMVGAMVA